VDAAHNPESMRVLAAGIRQLFPRHKLYVVMALLADKSAAQVLRPWQDLHPHFFFVPAATSRALPPARLAQVARQYHYHCEVFASARAGLEAAQHQTRGRALLVVAGSHYLLGELMAEGLLPYPYLKNLHLGENA